MSRWSKKDYRDELSFEQAALLIEEGVAKWAARRARGEDIDSLPVTARKLAPWENRYLDMLADRRRREKEFEEEGW